VEWTPEGWSWAVGPRRCVRGRGAFLDCLLLAAVPDPARAAAGADGVGVQAENDGDASRSAQRAACPDRLRVLPVRGRHGRSSAVAGAPWPMRRPGVSGRMPVQVRERDSRAERLDSMVNIVHCQGQCSGDVNVVERPTASPASARADDPTRPLTAGSRSLWFTTGPMADDEDRRPPLTFSSALNHPTGRPRSSGGRR
jgi:hypothetical protein